MTLGEALAEARGAAGLTVDEVSERTGIREVVIRSIEQDDFNSLGGALYVRGYLRAIARTLGLDPQPLIREFDATRIDAPVAEAATAAEPVAEAPTAELPAVAAPAAGEPVAEAPRAPRALDDTVPDWWEALPDWGEAVPAWGEHASIWGELEPVWAGSAGEGVPPGQAIRPGQAARPAPASRPVRAARPAGRPPRATRPRVRSGVAVVSVLAIVVLGVVGVSSAEIISKLGSSSHPAAAGDAATPAAGVTPSGAGTTAGQGAAGSATQAPTPTPAPAPLPAQRLAIRDVHAFGPDGLADGDNPGRAAYAITPGAPGPWRTQWYATTDFGHLKHGTGLLIDMGRPVTVTSVQIQLGSDWGADLQIRAGDAAVPGELPVVASRAGAGGLLTVGLQVPVRSRYVLLWWVKLPPTGSGTYRASVYGVVVTGHP